MAGLFGDYFDSKLFKGQSPEGLLAMLAQMLPPSTDTRGMSLQDLMGTPGAGPSQGFAPPQMSGGGGATMPLPMPPPTRMSDASGGPLMPLGASPMGPQLPGPQMSDASGGPLMPLPPAEPASGPTPVKTVEGTVENKPIAGNGTLYMPGARAEAPAALAAPAAQPGEHPLLTIGKHILQRLADNSAGLIAGGGAMMSGGLGKGFSAMAAASPLDIAARKERQGNEAIAATYQAVLQHQLAQGVEPATARATALAASQNPEILKTAIGPQFQHVTTKDIYGNETVQAFDPRTGNVFSVGKPAAGGGGAGSINPELVGEDYLKQFPADIQAAVKNYVNGISMPSANARQGFTQMVKIAAAKYGQDIGMPSDETSFRARQAMRNGLNVATPGSIGGQINAGNTAIGHLSDLAERAVKLGNWDVGGPDVSAAINKARAHLPWAAGSAQDAQVKAFNDLKDLYIKEITKFYAGSSGGVAERERAADRLNSANTPQALAEAIQTEREAMHSKLGALETQIKTALGPTALEEHPAVMPKSVAALEKLDRNIAVLKGNAPAVAETPAAKPITKAEYDRLPKGAAYTAPDGSQRTKQ
jgi:hypothetical protein